jgi:acyl carrier protein
MMSYREQIIAIVSKHMPSGSKTVDETLKLEELGLASLDVVEIIFEIEEAFQIQVPYTSPGRRVENTTGAGQDKDEFETIRDIVGAVEAVLIAKRGASSAAC